MDTQYTDPRKSTDDSFWGTQYDAVTIGLCYSVIILTIFVLC